MTPSRCASSAREAGAAVAGCQHGDAAVAGAALLQRGDPWIPGTRGAGAARGPRASPGASGWVLGTGRWADRGKSLRTLRSTLLADFLAAVIRLSISASLSCFPCCRAACRGCGCSVPGGFLPSTAQPVVWHMLGLCAQHFVTCLAAQPHGLSCASWGLISGFWNRKGCGLQCWGQE